MKKIFAILMLTFSTLAYAGPHGYHGKHIGPYHHRHYGSPGWGYFVAPLVIGGVVGAAIANRPSQAETVIFQPQPVIVKQENCTPWTETHSSDGTITRTRTCQQ